MSRSIGLAHILRAEDGTATGVWGTYELKTAFQPIFRFSEGKLTVAAFEGLVRPLRDGEAVAPAVFFGMVAPHDRLHVETATRTMHLLNAAVCLPQDVSIFVNFDPSIFTERSIAETALRDMRLVLHEAGIDPRRVVCEVTEQMSASDEALYEFVDALRAAGLRIAVDDYGSEDSDINRIKDLRPDIVKFDAKWTTRLMETGPGFALLSAMVDTFSQRGIETVFEGIEEGWQIELAEKCGASMLQGFALARPETVPGHFSTWQTAPLQAEAPPAPPIHPLPRTGRLGAARVQRTFGRRSVP